MTLQPLPPTHLDSLDRLLTERLQEAKLTHISLENVKNFLSNLFTARAGGIYVDNTEDPIHCLVIMHYTDPYSLTTIASVLLIYTAPEYRGNAADADVLFATAETYARMVGASSISGSSWIFRGSKGTDSLWVSKGYEPTETKYTKQVKV